MELKLYEDQEWLVSDLRKAMALNKSVLLQSATGSGKTAIAIHIIQNVIKKGKRCGFSVPRKELFNQTCETLDKYGIEHGYIASGKPYSGGMDVYVGMLPTMASRADELPDLDLVFIDETHFGESYNDKVIKHYKERGTLIVGLSATPWKSSGKGLGCWYDDMVSGKSIPWLIENKRLSDYKGFAPSNLDLSSLKVTAGDYNKGDVASFMESQSTITGDAVAHYKKLAMGKLNITFCASIHHSEIVTESFNANGVPSAHIDGKTPTDEKVRMIRAFAKKELLNLSCCDLLCFGFDLSQASGVDVCIESMSDLKPTKSLALQMQKWGRVLRYKPYPAIILDHANNFQEHGLPCSDREWTLTDRIQTKSKSEPVPPTRQCEECFSVHTPAPTCPDCGYVYKIVPRKVEEVEGELEEIQKEVARKQERSTQGKTDTLEGLIALGKKKGYKNPSFWAKKVLAGRR